MSDHYITLGNGTVWPVNVGDIGWRLRYTEPSRSDLLIAASVLSIYARMTDPVVRAGEAELMLRRARSAQREAPANEAGPETADSDPATSEPTAEQVRLYRENEALQAMVEGCRELVAEMDNGDPNDDLTLGWRDALAGIVGYPPGYRAALLREQESGQ